MERRGALSGYFLGWRLFVVNGLFIFMSLAEDDYLLRVSPRMNDEL